MTLVVLGRPEFSATDRAWISALRDRHRGAVLDPELGAHITLVFPTDASDVSTATSHLATVAGSTAPVDLAFRATTPVFDPLSKETYVYLVPDEGNSALIRLHDRLYSGPFADELRLDLPYTPHVSLGRFGEAKIAKALTDDLNAQEIEIRARLSTLELFQIPAGDRAPEQIARLAEITLRG